MAGNHAAGSNTTTTTTTGNAPEWLQRYELVGKIGEGAYGVVFLARLKSDRSKLIAIKNFKQSMSHEGISTTAIREIMLLRETCHENVVKLVDVHINHMQMSLHLAFDYADHDLSEIIKHHRLKIKQPINQYTVKSLLWQLLNGLHYLHSNGIMHRDLKPANILVMGVGEEHGVVKIADFGLARIFHAPLKPLSENGVVVTLWYRAPELLLGAKHYTKAVDMWAVGCIFAELLTLKPLFKGREVKATPATPNPFQLDQLVKIFKVLGHPTLEKWPDLEIFPHWETDEQHIQGHTYDSPGLHSFVNLLSTDPAYDLLSKMLQYDTQKRITAAQALEHEYFQMEPLPGCNALVSPQPGENIVNYPIRPVDTTADFQETTNIPPIQPLPEANALVQPQPGENIVNHPISPVATTTDFKETTNIPPIQPLPRHNALIQPQPAENIGNHPISPVATTADFKVTTNIPPIQPSPGHNALVSPQPEENIMNNPICTTTDFEETEDLTSIPEASNLNAISGAMPQVHLLIYEGKIHHNRNRGAFEVLAAV